MDSSDNFVASGTAEGRYRLLVESIADYAIYMLDPDGTVVNWNLGAERLKGYKASEIVGENFSRFYSSQDRAAGAPGRNLAKAAEEGRFEEEGWRYRKDGTRFWASVVIDRIVDPGGKLVGFAKITRDLTERQARDEALRNSEEQFRLLVKGVTDYALYMLDPGGNVVSWNSGAERIKGYAEEEILGQHFSRFYTEEERSTGEPQKNLEIARRVGSVEREGVRVRKDGSTFFAHVIIDALHNVDGELIGFAKVTRDITQRRATQRELETAREALFQSQKMEAIGQLTGGIAHDFNNLLMAILGSLEIAQRRMVADPRVSPFLDNAVKGAQRGAALTQRMLAFARRQELAMGPVDVLDTVKGMNDILERALGPSIFLTTNFPLSLPAVNSDRTQLESALLNLAVNARDAMPAGGTIAITANRRTARPGGKLRSGEYVVISVADSGEGMDAETLAKATEPFFTTKGIGKGTGLGLSMVHGLAEQSGGAFVLISAKDEGTTAELWLPLATGAAAEENASGNSVAGSASSKRILVVDDDFLVLLNTVTMAEDLGHEVFEAASGEEALAILEREQIDLLITDYAMPQMSGGQLATLARERSPALKVLVATGYAEMPEGHRNQFERLGKPFTESDLQSAIERAMNGSSA